MGSEMCIRDSCDGLSQDQKKYNIKLLGGDTVSSQNGIFITINMISLSNQPIIKRSTANIDDSIYVSGYIGDSAVGLNLIQNNSIQENLSESDKSYLLDGYYLPDPKFKIVELLRTYASSSMDTTDGLFYDLKTLSQSSGLHFHINKKNVRIANRKRNL